MKKAKTLVEQAIESVPGFGQSYEKFRNSMLAGGRSVKSIDNYGRKIAVVTMDYRLLMNTRHPYRKERTDRVLPAGGNNPGQHGLQVRFLPPQASPYS